MKRLSLVVLTAGIFWLCPSTQAGPIILQTYAGSFPANITGTLPNQNTALEETFTLSSLSNLTVTTTSYATGGFQSSLLLFNSAGIFITAGVPFGPADPATGIAGDVRLTSTLAAGTYTLALTDFLLNQALTATSLADGFTANYGSGTTFVDAGNNLRTGNFAFIIAASAVPEPLSLWLIAPFTIGLCLKVRRWKA